MTKLEDILNWQDEGLFAHKLGNKEATLGIDVEESTLAFFEADSALNEKVSVWLGSICDLEVDAIVNACNVGLMGGGGVDGAIHKAAGADLRAECALLSKPGQVGQTKITLAYQLPCRYVFHTVGPRGEQPALLLSCYRSILEMARLHGIRTIGFCAISTGAYGYPAAAAARVVLRFVRGWLHDHLDAIDRIVFVCWSQKEYDLYTQIAPLYFPRSYQD